MTTTTEELFRHNLWANLRLFDFCASLTDEQLDLSAPGTYGRVRDTLAHIVRAEERYAVMLGASTPEGRLSREAGFPGVDVLRQRALHSGEEMVRIAGQMDPTQVISGEDNEGPYAIQAAVFIIQAINHATEHRSHVVSILTQNGLTPPPIDGWAYGDSKGMMKMG